MLSARSGWPTIPQLFVDGEFVGGCDIVTELYESGELQKIVVAAAADGLRGRDALEEHREEAVGDLACGGSGPPGRYQVEAQLPSERNATVA